MRIQESLPRLQLPEALNVLIRSNYPHIKRVIDILVCISLIPALIIIIPIISLAIILDSPGSPIFVQNRAGKCGRVFKLYKFRTMKTNRDDSQERAIMQAFVEGEVIDNGSDRVINKPITKNNVTRVGSFLRRTSLDELPQIVNVLKGEMSLIGPRPNVLWEIEKYHSWHYGRLEALPGITGFAQVHGRSAITFSDIVNYDIFYVRNQSLGLDLWILWRTLLIVFAKNGAG